MGLFSLQSRTGGRKRRVLLTFGDPNHSVCLTPYLLLKIFKTSSFTVCSPYVIIVQYNVIEGLLSYLRELVDNFSPFFASPPALVRALQRNNQAYASVYMQRDI